ncbi:MAG: HD domain-containing protein [Proteobacteria bacterium]|nr:HD domain-containing protein [Pseudomonadota bacterium]NDD05582.1 HD domain-containing protein [Pseudomonadota bacterium]
MISKLSKGDIAKINALVEKLKVATTKNGKPYLDITLRDKDHSIVAKKWDYQQEVHGFITEGSVIKLVGQVEEYNGALQINLLEAEPSERPFHEFIRTSKFDIEEMWNDLVNIVATFKEPLTKYVTEEILMKHQEVIEAFKRAPAAAKMHNAWHGGLLEHVHSLCLIAEPVIKHYQDRYCEKISRDKVLFGLMLHDAGKIVEYDFSKPIVGLSPVGILTPHIVVGPAWIDKTASKFSPKGSDHKLEKAHLMHIVASHHGRIDWGSPVKPATLEAILVHHLDNLDSKMLHALDYVLGKPGPVPHFSEKSHVENTHFYQY